MQVLLQAGKQLRAPCTKTLLWQAILLLVGAQASAQQLVAFSRPEGAGKYTSGGRSTAPKST